MTETAQIVANARSTARTWGTTPRGLRVRRHIADGLDTAAMIATRQCCPELAAAYRDAAAIHRTP